MVSPDPLTPEREADLAKFLLEGHFKAAWFQSSDIQQKQSYLRDHVRGRYGICRK